MRQPPKVGEHDWEVAKEAGLSVSELVRSKTLVSTNETNVGDTQDSQVTGSSQRLKLDSGK